MVDEEAVANRESTMNFLRKLAKEGYDGAVVIVQKDGEVNALWNATPLEAHTMACLGKDAIWRSIRGEIQPEDVDTEDDDDQFGV